MKALLPALFIIFLLGCDDDSTQNGTSPCDESPDPCATADRGACTPDDQDPSGYTCQCEEGLTLMEPSCCAESPLPQGCDCSLTDCCPATMINVDGNCQCPDGTAWREATGQCEADPLDACSPNPCDPELFGVQKTACVVQPDESFTCECATGFTENVDGGCDIEVFETCPADNTCLGDYCVGAMGEGQCISDEDCHENLTVGNPTFCNPSAAGGICIGCTGLDDDECPTGTTCTPYGTCASSCTLPTDCPHGTCDTDSGYCVQSLCVSDQECPEGTLCVDENNDGSGMCQRAPCTETLCSVYNPQGECDPGASCIMGTCYDSCTPNPCTGLNRTLCVEETQGPQCECDSGYVEDVEGNCVPEICPSGFSCQDGYCVDPGELFQCVIAADCGGTMTCSPLLPTGTCSGCTDGTDCPAGFDTCLAGYCLRSCGGSNDCAEGMECGGSGYCGKKICSQESDCQPGYTCVAGSSESRCERIPCS
ncbi:hypothetical protein KKF84_14405 [Myxococcota bacterium]|nr:hypothetical protein [Myxococcota bacterium]